MLTDMKRPTLYTTPDVAGSQGLSETEAREWALALNVQRVGNCFVWTDDDIERLRAELEPDEDDEDEEEDEEELDDDGLDEEEDEDDSDEDDDDEAEEDDDEEDDS
jgi:hypothetical protein